MVVTAMPEANSPRATSTRVAGHQRHPEWDAGRTRSDMTLLSASYPRLPQDVPDAAQRVQQAFLAGVDLAPQMGHIGTPRR